MPCPDSFRPSGWLLACLLCLMAFLAGPAHAHKASDAYLQLQPDGAAQALLRWDIALRDLDAALDLDANEDRRLSWGEVRNRLPEIQAYALARLRMTQAGRDCRPQEAAPPALEERVDGNYLVLQMRTPCTPAQALDIDYKLFADIDPTHRGLLRVVSAEGAAPQIRSLDPSGGAVHLQAIGAQAGAGTSDGKASPIGFFRDGVHHILIGYDHVLFLICLLLPSVLRRQPGGGLAGPVGHWKEAAWPMLGVVTMFTIAHSITLALAGLKIVNISPRIIEPAIAITIILAALDNIRPLLRGRRKLFAFLFGLIHGFGFANVLAEMELPAGSFVSALLQFNLGVEAGQLLIVGVALCALLLLRHWNRYRPVVLRGGSAIAAGLAAVWLSERLLDVQILPFS